MEGTLIAVSRDALDEALLKIEELYKKLDGLTGGEEKPVCLKDAAFHLNCTERYIYNLMRDDPAFPAHKAGSGKLTFFKSELNDWLKSR